MSLCRDNIERFLRMRNWTPRVNEYTEIEYSKPGVEVVVMIDPDGHCHVAPSTDALLVGEADTLGGLQAVLYECGAIAYECSNCGEEGGEPVTTYSREWQGCREHGGAVDSTEERCSKCASGRRIPEQLRIPKIGVIAQTVTLPVRRLA